MGALPLPSLPSRPKRPTVGNAFAIGGLAFGQERFGLKTVGPAAIESVAQLYRSAIPAMHDQPNCQHGFRHVGPQKSCDVFVRQFRPDRLPKWAEIQLQSVTHNFEHGKALEFGILDALCHVKSDIIEDHGERPALHYL